MNEASPTEANCQMEPLSVLLDTDSRVDGISLDEKVHR